MYWLTFGMSNDLTADLIAVRSDKQNATPKNIRAIIKCILRKVGAPNTPVVRSWNKVREEVQQGKQRSEGK